MTYRGHRQTGDRRQRYSRSPSDDRRTPSSNVIDRFVDLPTIDRNQTGQFLATEPEASARDSSAVRTDGESEPTFSALNDIPRTIHSILLGIHQPTAINGRGSTPRSAFALYRVEHPTIVVNCEQSLANRRKNWVGLIKERRIITRQLPHFNNRVLVRFGCDFLKKCEDRPPASTVRSGTRFETAEQAGPVAGFTGDFEQQRFTRSRSKGLPMLANRTMPTARNLVTLFDAGSLGAHSDRELLACFQAGDGPTAHEAFRILVERHGPMVLGLCRSVVRDRHEAEDAFQATFLVLVRKAASIRRTDTLGPWLHGVAASPEARARLSQRRKRELSVISDVPGRDEPPPDRSSIEELLHPEIAKLPGSFRRPLILCCLQGLSYRLAAERLGCKEPALRGRLERAKKATDDPARSPRRLLH